MSSTFIAYTLCFIAGVTVAGFLAITDHWVFALLILLLTSEVSMKRSNSEAGDAGTD